MFQILVVEDDASLRRLMSAALKQHGYTPYTANDGVEALDMLDKTNIDMIISDIMMPNMDGYELTRQLRRAGFNMPILMVTAKEAFEDKQEGFMAGTDDYMVKPIDINEMILRVGALLRRAKLASDHKLTIGSCVLDYDAVSISVNGGEALRTSMGGRYFRRRNLCCFSSFSPIPTRSSHAVSFSTRSGEWITMLTSELSMFTSSVFVNATVNAAISR